MTLALLGGVAGTYCTYVVSGRQEVRVQRATHADELAHDRIVAPFRVEGSNDGGVEYSISSSHILEIAGTPVDPEHPDRFAPVDDKTLVGVPLGGSPSIVVAHEGFTLVGQRSVPVDIVGMKARVTSRLAPLSGTIVAIEGEGVEDDVKMGFDLDSRDLSARSILDQPGKPLSTTRFFADVHVTLARDERVEFEVSTYTASCRCAFVIDVTLSDGTVVAVDDNGDPWRISAFAKQYSKSYIWDVITSRIQPCAWPRECLRMDS
ncbi:hypothetical protein Are01nite_81200 [Actinoplanes regularis]|nr:hypothetical protein Are01nite_81200 [Actinoplanes regularis]